MMESKVVLLADGKNYELSFNNRALYLLEDTLGSGIAGYLLGGESTKGIKFINGAVWAGLQHKYPNITQDTVIDNLITPNMIPDLQIKVVSLLMDALGIQITDDAEGEDDSKN